MSSARRGNGCLWPVALHPMPPHSHSSLAARRVARTLEYFADRRLLQNLHYASNVVMREAVGEEGDSGAQLAVSVELSNQTRQMKPISTPATATSSRTSATSSERRRPPRVRSLGKTADWPAYLGSANTPRLQSLPYWAGNSGLVKSDACI